MSAVETVVVEGVRFGSDSVKGVILLTDIITDTDVGYPVALFGDMEGPIDSQDIVLFALRSRGWNVTGVFVNHPEDGGLIYKNVPETAPILVDRAMILRDNGGKPLMMVRPSPDVARAFEIVFAEGFNGWSQTYDTPPLRPTWVEALASLEEGRLPRFYPPRLRVVHAR